MFRPNAIHVMLMVAEMTPELALWEFTSADNHAIWSTLTQTISNFILDETITLHFACFL